MKLIVGLGNPGPQYELTRHNAGFILIDLFAEFFKIKIREGKGDWHEGKGKIENEEFYLLKPMTLMNNSGIAVKEFSDIHKVDLKNMLVLVDDFQIPFGTIRVRRGGSDGGQNGLASIIYHLGSDEFPRMRIGIGKEEPLKKDKYVDYVLNNFTKDEIEILKKLIPDYIECIRTFISEGITKTMNSFNKSFIEPPKEVSKKESKENKEN